ncbi:CGNR zinc finger domain-containing protein [Micromonospora sp. DT47]|uniref:CGNR zinc finger domain-containing protein n=1 Tax=Micromonospora sp. DT47 TaxID=3393431 RepID=UPI003CE9440A
MHWIEVEGTPLPKRYGGHPALDFCNTWAGWNTPRRNLGGQPDLTREWLPTYDRLALWSGYVQLLTPETTRRIRRHAHHDRDQADKILHRAHRLRDHLYRLLLNPDDRHAFDTFATVAQSALQATRLEIDPDGAPRRVLPDTVGLALPLFAVARSAESLLTSADAHHRVRACPGDECGWLFLDLRGRRRWCDMATCGNRAKVRAHAARSKPAATP